MAIDDNTSYELTGAQVKDLANKIKAKAADNIFVGATSAAPGSKGLVPQPQAGDDTKFLSGDGLWKTVSQYNLPIASSTTLGGIKVGDNLTIDPVTGVLDADGSTYTAGNGININANDEISVDTSVVAEVSDLPTKTSDLANDGSDGTSTYVEADELAPVATSGDYDDLTNKPTIPTVNNATLTVQKNGTSVGTFTANASSNKTINITVPTTAADVSALPDTTKYGAAILMSIDNTTYQVTTTLKDQDGNTLGTAQTIDLPLESVVVSGAYDSQTKEVVLTLVNGSAIRFSVADLVSGLQTEITASNKLSADLVDDTNTTHKFVTAANKTTWDGKQDALTAGSNIQINGTTISATDTTYSDFVGATSSVAGTTGLVPAPTAGDQDKVLTGAGTWDTRAKITMTSTDPGSGSALSADNYVAVYGNSDGQITSTDLATNSVATANLQDYSVTRVKLNHLDLVNNGEWVCVGYAYLGSTTDSTVAVTVDIPADYQGQRMQYKVVGAYECPSVNGSVKYTRVEVKIGGVWKTSNVFNSYQGVVNGNWVWYGGSGSAGYGGTAAWFGHEWTTANDWDSCSFEFVASSCYPGSHWAFSGSAGGMSGGHPGTLNYGGRVQDGNAIQAFRLACAASVRWGQGAGLAVYARRKNF